MNQNQMDENETPDNRPQDGRICDCEDAPCCGHYELWKPSPPSRDTQPGVSESTIKDVCFSIHRSMNPRSTKNWNSSASRQIKSNGKSGITICDLHHPIRGHIKLGNSSLQTHENEHDPNAPKDTKSSKTLRHARWSLPTATHRGIIWQARPSPISLDCLWSDHHRNQRAGRCD